MFLLCVFFRVCKQIFYQKSIFKCSILSERISDLIGALRRLFFDFRCISLKNWLKRIFQNINKLKKKLYMCILLKLKIFFFFFFHSDKQCFIFILI